VRNAKFSIDSPEVDIPEKGEYLWDWYFTISRTVGRIKDGKCYPISPNEMKTYFDMIDCVVYPHEYDILFSMDSAFCDELNEELYNYQLRQQEPK